ncbi:hypothetical protein ACHAWF_015769 [Thalassiosira exigua]
MTARTRCKSLSLDLLPYYVIYRDASFSNVGGEYYFANALRWSLEDGSLLCIRQRRVKRENASTGRVLEIFQLAGVPADHRDLIRAYRFQELLPHLVRRELDALVEHLSELVRGAPAASSASPAPSLPRIASPPSAPLRAPFQLRVLPFQLELQRSARPSLRLVDSLVGDRIAIDCRLVDRGHPGLGRYQPRLISLRLEHVLQDVLDARGRGDHGSRDVRRFRRVRARLVVEFRRSVREMQGGVFVGGTCVRSGLFLLRLLFVHATQFLDEEQRLRRRFGHRTALWLRPLSFAFRNIDWYCLRLIDIHIDLRRIPIDIFRSFVTRPRRGASFVFLVDLLFLQLAVEPKHVPPRLLRRSPRLVPARPLQERVVHRLPRRPLGLPAHPLLPPLVHDPLRASRRDRLVLDPDALPPLLVALLLLPPPREEDLVSRVGLLGRSQFLPLPPRELLPLLGREGRRVEVDLVVVARAASSLPRVPLRRSLLRRRLLLRELLPPPREALGEVFHEVEDGRSSDQLARLVHQADADPTREGGRHRGVHEPQRGRRRQGIPSSRDHVKVADRRPVASHRLDAVVRASGSVGAAVAQQAESLGVDRLEGLPLQVPLGDRRFEDLLLPPDVRIRRGSVPPSVLAVRGSHASDEVPQQVSVRDGRGIRVVVVVPAVDARARVGLHRPSHLHRSEDLLDLLRVESHADQVGRQVGHLLLHQRLSSLLFVLRLRELRHDRDGLVRHRFYRLQVERPLRGRAPGRPLRRSLDAKAPPQVGLLQVEGEPVQCHLEQRALVFLRRCFVFYYDLGALVFCFLLLRQEQSSARSPQGQDRLVVLEGKMPRQMSIDGRVRDCVVLGARVSRVCARAFPRFAVAAVVVRRFPPPVDVDAVPAKLVVGLVVVISGVVVVIAVFRRVEPARTFFARRRAGRTAALAARGGASAEDLVARLALLLVLAAAAALPLLAFAPAAPDVVRAQQPLHDCHALGRQDDGVQLADVHPRELALAPPGDGGDVRVLAVPLAADHRDAPDVLALSVGARLDLAHHRDVVSPAPSAAPAASAPSAAAASSAASSAATPPSFFFFVPSAAAPASAPSPPAPLGRRALAEPRPAGDGALLRGPLLGAAVVAPAHGSTLRRR